MEKLFGVYRTAAPIAAKSANPIFYARSPSSSSWDAIVKIFDTIVLTTNLEQDAATQKLRILTQLTHPHLLPTFAIGIENEHPYVVSKYAASGSLRDRMNRGAPLSVAECIEIVTQVGEALQYAHEQNIVHGNIKPENILFDKNGTVLLADFSLVSILGETTTQTTMEEHNIYYPAGEPINEESDQYALGCLAYELFTGYTPSTALPPVLAIQERLFAANSAAIHPLHLNPTLPGYIGEVLLKAVASYPIERYESVAAFIAALKNMPAARVHTTTVGIPVWKKPVTFTKWGGVLLFCALMVILISSVYPFFFLSARSPSQQVHQSSVGAVIAKATPIVPTPTAVIPTLTPTAVVPTPALQMRLPANPQPTAAPQPIPTTSSVPTPSPTPGLTCAISYQESEWNRSNFLLNLTIRNTGPTQITHWTLQWTFTDDQQVKEAWNATASQQGQQVTLQNVARDGSIPSHTALTGVSLLGTFSGHMTNPTSFILNGVACD